MGFDVHVVLSGDIDDLEFWLSTDTTPAKQQTTPTEPPATATEDTPTKTSSSKKRSKKKGGAKVEPAPEVTPVVSTVMDEPEGGGEGGEGGEEGKRRKKKGEKVSHDFSSEVLHSGHLHCVAIIFSLLLPQFTKLS